MTQRVHRKVTIKAVEESCLITLKQEDYMGMMENLPTYKLDGMADFFYNLPLFHYIDRPLLLKLAKKAKHVQYGINTLVLR